MSTIQIIILIAIASAATVVLRALPFLCFTGREVPPFVHYLGRVFPSAVAAMLVVFCLKDTNVVDAPHGVPEVVAIAATVGVYLWRNAPVASALAGTVVYMVMIRIM